MNWSKLFDNFVPQKKCDPLTGSLTAAIAPAAINTVGNIASSLFGSSQQKTENQKNRDFALDMWNRQNEYNSPKNQRKLLEEGGYSPYLFNEVTPSSTAGAAQTPSTAPLPTFQNPVNGSAQLLQNGLQIEANVDLQRMKSLETVADVLVNLYKEGGQSQVDEFMRKFAPALDSINFSGSHAETYFNEFVKDELSKRYNLDMDSLNKDLQYRLGSEYSAQQIKTNIDETNAKIKQILNDVDLSKIRTDADLKKIAADIVVAGAQAWNLRKVGEYYEADAKTVDALRDGLQRQAKAVAGLKENQLYNSNIEKESNSYVYGYMTSDKGKRFKANKFKNQTEWTGSDFGFAVDQWFGNYIKIGGSANANYSHSISEFER